MDGKIYVTITAGKSRGLPAIDEYVFEYTPKFKEGGFVLIKVNDNFSHPDTGANLKDWIELYYRTSYHYVNQMLLTLYSINWDGNEVFGEKAITPHKTFGAAEYYIERHNVYQYESKMQPLNEYIDDIITQVNKLPTSSKLHFNRLDKDYGKFFHLFVGGINETDDEIIRTGDCASVHFEYNSNMFCGNEVIKNNNGLFNLSAFVSENDTVGGDDNVEYHFDSFDILFKDNINFKELKFVIRYYTQNNYHSASTNESTIRSFTAYQYDSYTAPYVLAAICDPVCFAARMFDRIKDAYDFLYKNYFTQFNNKKIDSFVNCRLTRIRGENEASAYLLYNGENFILADVPSKSITGMRSLFLGNNDSVPMFIGTHGDVEKLLALGATHQVGDKYSFTIDYLDSDGTPQIKYTSLEKSYDPSDERRETEASIAHYINYQHFALKQYSEHGLNVFTIHNSVPPYKYYLDEQFKKTATTINLLKEKQIKPTINTMGFIIDMDSKDIFSHFYHNTAPLIQIPACWRGTKT